jgi:hypothetical protein
MSIVKLLEYVFCLDNNIHIVVFPLVQDSLIKYLVQKDNQRSTKHAYKTKDRETRTPLKIGGELMCSGRVAVPAPLVTPVVLI